MFSANVLPMHLNLRCDFGARFKITLRNVCTTAVLAAYFACLQAPLLADPIFVNRAQNLPISHVYDGGWEHFVGGGVAMFDCNGDDKTDLFAAGGANLANLLVNASEDGGDIQFLSAPFPSMLGVTGAYPIDIDSDNLIDLVVLRNGPNVVLQGLGNCEFQDASLLWGLPSDSAWSTAFSATWELGQDWPTLAIGNYVDASNPDGPFGTCDTNWLIRPQGHRFATPVALTPGFCPLSMLFSDWQRSGTPMLRISNDRQYYVRIGYEQMWQLDPLREMGEADGWRRMQIWGMGIASQDISGDGLPEVMLTSMGDQMLMNNTGGGFSVVPYPTGTFATTPFIGDDGRPSTGWHAQFGDIDNDGLTDLFIAKGNVDQMPGLAMRDPNNLLMQQPGGTFVEMADVAGIATTERSRGAGLADLNHDGLLDLVVVNRRAPLEVWQNATRDAGNWLAITLHQDGYNTNAIGAVVELRLGERVLTQEITVGGGHVSGGQLPVHFGLGALEGAETRVIWPDGSNTDWTYVAANQHLRINHN
jgi:hypothetical protein